MREGRGQCGRGVTVGGKGSVVKGGVTVGGRGQWWKEGSVVEGGVTVGGRRGSL